MRVLMVSGNAPPLFCGIGDYSQFLSQALRQEGIEVVHLGFQEKNWQFSFKGFFLAKKISSLLRDQQFDLIHLQYEAFSFSRSFILPLFLSWQRLPLVITFHEVFQKNVFERFRDIFLARQARALIVSDQGRLKSLNLLTTLSVPVKVWGVGASLPVPRGKGILSSVPLVGYFGFINAVKSLEILFKAFAEAKKTIRPLRLRLIGNFDPKDEAIRNWQKWCEVEGFSSDVEWIPSPEASVAARLIQECWVMVLPFTDGATPRRSSLQSCLALGKAVLSTPPSVLEQEFQDLQLIPVREGDRWAKSLISILTDESARRKSEEISLAVAQKFQWSEIARRHHELYQTILR